MAKTIIVSNRLPVKVQRYPDGLAFQPSEGGLATGLGAIYRAADNVWVGWPGLVANDAAEQQAVTEQLRAGSMAPVFLTEADITGYYEGFSNATLWPTFHYFPQYATYDDDLWAAYVAVNQKFCDAVLALAGPDDTIWVHDYQLLLLPQLLRQARPEATIGFFLHIPFPSYELVRVLPWRAQLLEGLLGADLIGFHTFGYMRHFLSSVSQVLGLPIQNGQIETPERTVLVDAFPMGIDYGRFADTATDPATLANAEDYRQALPGVRVILSVDRLDYSKGIAERLRAFELMLRRYPEWRERVSLVMVVVPSRDQVAQYQALKVEVDELVGRINAQYRTVAWTPIHYYYRSLPFEELAAWYHVADVGLVTPIRDGMILVAKEFVASKTDQHGVLILSERAGAARELSDAIVINPTDTGQLAEAMHQALVMPEEEQQQRLSAMQALVRQYDVFAWSELFTTRLQYAKLKQLALTTDRLTPADARELAQAYRAAERRLLLLDYDGTLVPFRVDPQRAKPDAELLALLRQLSADPTTAVALISGRDRHTLTEWFGDLPVGLIAEHGVWLRQPGEAWNLFHELRADWKQELRPILEQYVVRTTGAFIEEKDFSLAWHFRRADPDLGSVRARELMSHLTFLVSNTDLQVIEGDKVVEVRNAGIHKGAAAARWIGLYQPDFILALGDDRTDEDTFNAVPATAYTVKVGVSVRSQARYHVASVGDARRLLQRLAAPETDVQIGTAATTVRLRSDAEPSA